MFRAKTSSRTRTVPHQHLTNKLVLSDAIPSNLNCSSLIHLTFSYSSYRKLFAMTKKQPKFVHHDQKTTTTLHPKLKFAFLWTLPSLLILPLARANPSFSPFQIPARWPMSQHWFRHHQRPFVPELDSEPLQSLLAMLQGQMYRSLQHLLCHYDWFLIDE